MAASPPSLAVRRYGTDEPARPSRLLRAGPLEALLEAGNLRHIRFGGVEIIRAISFIVRDRNWGTYDPVLADLVVSERPGAFAVSYTAIVDDGVQRLDYGAAIEGHADGRLDFSARALPGTDFLTNRTGFVVLHPIDGVAGAPVTIEDVEGTVTPGRFPDLIEPAQPMMNLRALTHEAAPGLSVVCRMVGDTFEMEDQRNWTDASYKTYVRPLARPWPYVLSEGHSVEQGVHLVIEGGTRATATADEVITLALGTVGGPFPTLGLGYDPQADAAARSRHEVLREVGAAHLVCHYDPRRGHGPETLAEAVAVAGSIGATPWLEAVIVGIDEAETEVLALGAVVRSLGSPFATILLSPAADLKGTLPGSAWPPAPEAKALFEAARVAFPGARLGGGMFSLFTELNRKRPPVPLLDVVTFTTAALVHAGDDLSVMESLETLPAVFRSAAAIAGTTPLAVGPSAIGMRLNPYGASPEVNPLNTRRAMNLNDPRQRGLLGAAWAVGYMAQAARAGLWTVTLGGLTGPFGILSVPQAWPQPWFDEEGGVFPVFHILKGLASLAGLAMREIASGEPARLQALAVETPDGVTIWVANLTGSTVTIEAPPGLRDLAIIDDDSFCITASTTDAIETLTRPFAGPIVSLQPYATARLRLDAARP